MLSDSCMLCLRGAEETWNTGSKVGAIGSYIKKFEGLMLPSSSRAMTSLRQTCFPVLVVQALIALALAASTHKLPASYPTCKRTDPNVDKCLLNAVSSVLKQLPGGIPSLQVVPLDPLVVPSIEIKEGTRSINLNLKLTNAKVTGLTTATITSVKSNLAKYDLEFEGTEPEITLEADYEMSGKFLILPVEGKGKCKFTFKNLKALLSLHGDGQTKDGKVHWDVKKLNVILRDLDLMTVNFENLFNGDPTLGNGFKTLLAENWREFWDGLRPSFEATFGYIFEDYSRKIFSKVPFDDIFPEK